MSYPIWTQNILEAIKVQATEGSGDLVGQSVQTGDGNGEGQRQQPPVEDPQAQRRRELEEEQRVKAEIERKRLEEEERVKAEIERKRLEALALFQKRREEIDALYRNALDSAPTGEESALTDLEESATGLTDSGDFEGAMKAILSLGQLSTKVVNTARSNYEKLREEGASKYGRARKAVADAGALTRAFQIAEEAAKANRYRDAIEKLGSLDTLCDDAISEGKASFEKARRDATPAYQTALVVAGSEEKSGLIVISDNAAKFGDDFKFPQAVPLLVELKSKSEKIAERQGTWITLLAQTRELVLECLRSEKVDPLRAQGIFVGQLNRATDLYKQGKVDEAKLSMADLKGKAEDALKTARAPDDVNEDPTAKDIRLGKEAQQRRDAKKQESAMVLLGLPPSFDSKEVQEIMDRHFVEAPKEAAAFKDFDDIDDVLALKEKTAKVDALNAINLAMTAAAARHKELSLALAKLPQLTKEQRLTDPKVAEAIDRARRLVMEMTAHIPPEWLSTWSPNFVDRIKTLTSSDLEKEDIRKEAKKGFDQLVQGEHVKAFKEAIEKRSATPLERYDFYFDQLVKPIKGGESYVAEPDPSHFENPQAYTKAKEHYEQNKEEFQKRQREVEEEQAELRKLYEIQDALIKTANRIRDAGGTLDEVRQAIQHVPETFWPPQFVETLQAWRKVERERTRLEVQERMKGKEGLDKVETAQDCLTLVATALGETTSWLEDNRALNLVSSFVNEAKGCWGAGQEVGEALKQGDLSLATGIDAGKLHDGIVDSVNTLVNGVTSLKDVPGIPEKGMFAAKVVPGLALAAAGIDLYMAIKALAEHSVTTHRSRKMKGEAEQDWAEGRDEDGGAFVRALKNELVARAQQLTKDSLEVTTAGIEVAGAALEVGGITGAAGLGLKITGKVISYGGKVVFTNIDWSHANKVKPLIEEARAGNPVARIQIMEDCGLYAKLYIAILAREGHRLATLFIAQRGLEETDLTQAMSMKILADALLKDADQRNETEVADNLLEANAEGLLGAGVVKGAKALVTKIVESVGDVGKDRTVVYDPTWAHNPVHVVTDTRASWDLAKNGALAAGLYEQDTGVGRAMDAVKSSRSALSTAKPTEKKAKTLALRDALDALQEKLQGYSPLTNPQGEKKDVVGHKGMTLYVLAVKAKAQQERDDIEKSLVSDGFKTPGAVVINDSDLDAAQWKRNFATAVDKACLPLKDDFGVEAALKKLGSDSDYAALALITDKQKQRKDRLSYRENALALIKTVNGLWSHCGDCTALQNYLDRLRTQAAGNAKDLAQDLFLDPWNLPAVADTLSSADWKKVWDDACLKGVADRGAGDAGLGSALTEAGKKATALKQAELGFDAVKTLAARRDLTKAYAAVFVSANQFVGAQKDAVEALKRHALDVGRAATTEIGLLKDKTAQVTFAPVVGFTQTAWKATNDNAIKAGALVKDDRAGELTKAFDTYEKANTSFGTEPDLKKKRVFAVQTKEALDAINKAVTFLLAGDYGDHDTMKVHLLTYQTAVTDELKNPLLKGWLDGSLAPTFVVPSPFDWTDANWQEAKKAGIAAGAIADKATGFGKSLTKAKKSYDAWANAKLPEKPTKRKLAEVDIAAAKSIARNLKAATSNTSLTVYLDACINWTGFTFA